MLSVFVFFVKQLYVAKKIIFFRFSEFALSTLPTWASAARSQRSCGGWPSFAWWRPWWPTPATQTCRWSGTR